LDLNILLAVNKKNFLFFQIFCGVEKKSNKPAVNSEKSYNSHFVLKLFVLRRIILLV